MNDKEQLAEQLWCLLHDELPHEKAEEVRRRLESDSEARELFQFIRQFDSDMASLRSQELLSAARSLSRRALSDFLAKREENGAIRGITVYDSWLLPLPDGTRPTTVENRRINYRINGWKLEIVIYPVTADSREIIGMVSGPLDGTTLKVQVTAGLKNYTTETDEDGVFRLRRIPVDSHELAILKGEERIGFVEIEL